MLFRSNDTATTEIYTDRYTLSLHDALPISAREMATTVTRRTGLPLELWDERMSTARALAAIREQGGSTRGRKADVDALAAAVLLQHFLDARKNRTERTEGSE